MGPEMEHTSVAVNPGLPQAPSPGRSQPVSQTELTFTKTGDGRSLFQLVPGSAPWGFLDDLTGSSPQGPGLPGQHLLTHRGLWPAAEFRSWNMRAPMWELPFAAVPTLPCGLAASSSACSWFIARWGGGA